MFSVSGVCFRIFLVPGAVAASKLLTEGASLRMYSQTLFRFAILRFLEGAIVQTLL